MDEEASFADLLSQSVAPSRPSWEATRPTDDPWANPFSDTPSTNPFATEASPFGSASTYISPPPDSPVQEISPYVQKLEEDADAGVGVLPDPPSVIAAREQEESGFTSPIQTPTDPFTQPRLSDPALVPFSPPAPEAQPPTPSQPSPPSRRLPSELLDDDILGASDPSVSLKKAFVKSASPQKPLASSSNGTQPKKYVFKPDRAGSAGSSKGKEEVKVGIRQEVKKSTAKAEKTDVRPETVTAKTEEHTAVETEDAESSEAKENGSQVDSQKAERPDSPTEDTTQPEPSAPPPLAHDESEKSQPARAPPPLHLAPTSIPLPTSSETTPTPSRSATPAPPALSEQTAPPSPPPPKSATTPTVDRVAVSPLDAPSSQADYGFKSLSIGGSSSSNPPPPPSKSPVHQNGNGTVWPPHQKVESPLSSKLSGRGWGMVDEQDDGGLFGKGGPSVRPDPWGGSEVGAWGETGIPSTTSDATSQIASGSSSSIPQPTEEVEDNDDDKPLGLLNGNAKRVKPAAPLFQISVGDPTRVGDPVRGYTVYTIRTHTTSPHYRRNEFSVLRRFSDFLWLFDALTMNNPGVIVPPMPDKHTFGRFQDQFIETRRLALQRCLTKVTSHPVLQLDPDLRLFLESDAFAIEAKSRRAEIPPDKQGLLAGWTGPKYVEQDDWFDSRKVFLDNLESQLKSLSKSIETASKSRLDMAISMGDFADSMTALAESDLGSAMCSALARLSDLARRERDSNEQQAKSDVMYLLNMSDEYVRFIGSVRLAFASRIKAYQNWQNLEKEVVRLRSVREKLRQAGKLGDRTSSSLAEIGEVDRRSRDASTEFEAVSRLVKSELARFERERVDEFKRVLERYLDGQIVQQKDLITAWEEYHGVVLKMVQKSQQ